MVSGCMSMSSNILIHYESYLLPTVPLIGLLLSVVPFILARYVKMSDGVMLRLSKNYNIHSPRSAYYKRRFSSRCHELQLEYQYR